MCVCVGCADNVCTLLARYFNFSPDIRRYLISTAMLAATIDGGIHVVVYNLYLLRLGYGPDLIGAINAVGIALFAIACVPAGRLGERFGLLRVMRIGMGMILLGAVFPPLIGWLPVAWHTPLLMLGTAIVNIGLAAYFVASAPYITRNGTPEQRMRMFSLQSVAFAVFGFLGSLVGGWLPTGLAALGVGPLTQPQSYQWTLWTVPLLLAFACFMLSRMNEAAAVEPSVTTVGATLAPAAAPLIGLFAFFGLLRFLQVGGVGVMQTFFNVYMDSALNVDTATIGSIQAVARLLGVPMALAIPWMTRRLGSGGTAALALGIAGLAILPMTLITLPWVAAASYIVVWLTTPVRYAAFMVFILGRTPARVHGTLNGTQEALAGASFALIAYGGGLLIGPFGYSLVFTLGAIGMLSAATLLALYAFRTRK